MKVKRVLTGFLIACLVLVLAPTSVFAEGGAGLGENDSGQARTTSLIILCSNN